MCRLLIILVGLSWVITSCNNGTDKLYTEAEQERSVKKALEYAKSSNPIHKGDAYYLISKFYQYDSGSFDMAVKYGFDALANYTIAKDIEKISRQHNNIAEIFRQNQHYRLAIEHFKKSIKITRKEYNKKKRGIYLAKCYWKIEDRAAALTLLNESLDYFQGENDYFTAETLTIMGLISLDYGIENNEELAISDAFGLFHQSYQLYQDSSLQATALNNMGNAHLRMGNYIESIPYLESALELHEKHSKNDKILITLDNIGEYHFQTKNYQAATRYFNRSIALNNSMNHSMDNSFGRLYDIYQFEGLQSKSDSMFSLYRSLTKIEISEKELMRKYIMDLQYEYIKKTIDLNNSKDIVNNLKIQTWVIIVVSMLLFLALVFYWVVVRASRIDRDFDDF